LHVENGFFHLLIFHHEFFVELIGMDLYFWEFHFIRCKLVDFGL